MLAAQCSANRSGSPLARKRRDLYAGNHSALQARIEMAHRPFIEVNDAAGRQRPNVVDLDDDLLADSLNESKLRSCAILNATKFLTQVCLDGRRPDGGIIAFS